MILDDEVAFNLIVELMEIRDEPHMIEHTRGWINEVGLEKVLEIVLNMHTSINERKLEYNVENK